MARVAELTASSSRLGIQQECVRVNVEKSRCCSRRSDGSYWRNAGIWNRDDFMSFSYVQCSQCEGDGIGSIAHTHGVIGLHEVGEFSFECLDFRSKNQSP